MPLQKSKNVFLVRLQFLNKIIKQHFYQKEVLTDWATSNDSSWNICNSSVGIKDGRTVLHYRSTTSSNLLVLIENSRNIEGRG